jgi:hypothetical protein
MRKKEERDEREGIEQQVRHGGDQVGVLVGDTAGTEPSYKTVVSTFSCWIGRFDVLP